MRNHMLISVFSICLFNIILFFSCDELQLPNLEIKKIDDGIFVTYNNYSKGGISNFVIEKYENDLLVDYVFKDILTIKKSTLDSDRGLLISNELLSNHFFENGFQYFCTFGVGTSKGYIAFIFKQIDLEFITFKKKK